jgi:putative hydrolase of the HAD superfamily
MSGMPSAPLVVLFDADGVVQSGPGDLLEQVTGLLPEGVDPAAFVTALFEAELATLTGDADFVAVVQWTLDAHGADTAGAERLAALWHRLETDPRTVAAITALRAGGTRCYLATNQHAFRTAYMREHLGYAELFDGQFYSCELGVAKPDPAYFTRIVRELGVEPGQVLFLDDNAANVRGAHEAGLHAVLFHHRRDGAQALSGLLADHGLPAPAEQLP